MERRRRRSEDPQEALVLQLERVREIARLDALVLASDEGLSIAHSGEEELCAELAALAPFLPRETEARTEAGSEALRVQPVSFGSLLLYLVSYCRDQVSDQLDGWLDHASRGVVRILDA
jgi:hypothetical protein